MARTLDTLSPGEQGRVAALDFPPAMLRRLRELGFLPGGVITALHRAPFGGKAVQNKDIGEPYMVAWGS